jgi:AsmA protein
MTKTIKYILIGFAALVALLLAAIGILAATIDPNDYKPQIIKLVQDKTQRTLSIPGEIKLTIFPRIGADLGKVSISERNSKNEFASIDSAKVSLALMPLLSKQFVVDRIAVNGLRASVRRFKDGTTNYDDLLSKEEPKGEAGSGQQVDLDIAGVNITDANVLYDDQQQGRKLGIANLDLDTGKIADGVPSNIKLAADVKGSNPDINTRVSLNSGFTFDRGQQHYILKGTDAELNGKLADFSDLVIKVVGDIDLKLAEKRFNLDGIKLTATGKRGGQPIDARLEVPKLAITDTQVSGGKLNGNARVVEGPRTITANFSAPSFEGSPQAFKVPSLALDVAVRDAKLDAIAKIAGTVTGDIDKLLFASPQLKLALSGKQDGTALDGTLSTPFSANLNTQLVELSNIVAAFTLPNPGGGTLKLNASGKAQADLGKQNLSTALKGKLDESSFDAKFGMSKFTPAAYTFDIDIDRIDADRYKSKSAAAQPAPKATEPAAEQPLDLSALKDLQAAGSLRIGFLKVENIKVSTVKMDLRAADGKININPLTANLYGGSVNGSLSATASKSPQYSVRQNLAGINIGPLLKDAIDKQPLDGKGNVQLDITTRGGAFAQMKKQLNGTARMELRDGAVHGINIAQVIRNAKAKLGEIRGNEAAQKGTGSSIEKTDFSEMAASFRIVNGVARNDDLNIKSPLIRVAGAGDINLAQDQLDYLVKATVVSTLQGQGGPELQSIKGLTIPVRLSGPFTAIDWNVDFKGLAGALAQQKIDERKGEIQGKAKKELDEQESKAREQIKEGLKGLLGK